ncbi:heparinase II/III family protein [Gaetbulibacter sp. M240]|uniref:heparinase II/III domain-containing protein n=1 Tax=Gaetbulibacter sp. M240 TaxID=3126511 RepID=UPI00374FB42B
MLKSGDFFNFFLLLLGFFFCLIIGAQNPERPFILVKIEDRPAILQKIKTEPWAKKAYNDLISELEPKVRKHEEDPEKFLNGLPLDWKSRKRKEMPPFFKTYHVDNGKQKNLDNVTDTEFKNAETLKKYLNIGIHSGVAYFLTGEDKYAQCATDILNVYVNAVLQSELSEWHQRGGWLYPYDGFREVRDLGEKLPVIYDFIVSFLKDGGQAYDLIKRTKVDFPVDKAQEVFRTYADISINYGQINSNHPALEATNLVYNALAMENLKERDSLLAYFLEKKTPHQDPLEVMAGIYKNEGDIWPESSQYLNAVSNILTELMFVVDRYKPELNLGKKYSNVLYSLPKLDYLVYPNNEIIRWGDGKRNGSPSYLCYEFAFQLGKLNNDPRIINKFGPLLFRAIESGDYESRSVQSLLLPNLELTEEMAAFELPTTDKVEHAGIFLQRNLSSTEDPNYGLMCFVGGAHMVHGHAEGMNIELYGLGEVLGVDNGRGKYQQDIHENYSRIFAAHNTIIVNGSSQGQGGWVGLAINKVGLIAMEPNPSEPAVSPNHSFTRTSFLDDKGDGAEATQERTLALIRTSPKTGYYVDIFRSKSKLPNEYHDYLYHNIGDTLVFEDSGLKFHSDKLRFMANAKKIWKQNGRYRNPGWHFFKNVKTSQVYNSDVQAKFILNHLYDGKKRYMNVFILGNQNREYTAVQAPKTFDAPEPYEEKSTPTLVIRQNGEAWKQPFGVIYEPQFASDADQGIQAVVGLKQDNQFKGFMVQSHVEGQTIIQYIISQEPESVYRNDALDFVFKGAFAVLTCDTENKLQNVYIGKGSELTFENLKITSKDQKPISIYMDLSNDKPEVNGTKNAVVLFNN